MARIYYRCEPFSKADVTLALESGVDGVIVPRAQVEKVAALSRCTVWACEDVASVPLNVKADEEALVARLKAGETACLARGWEIIPVENLLAQADNVLAEAGSLEEARLAAGILERGVDGIVVLPEALAELKAIVAQCKISQGREELQKAVITRGPGAPRLRRHPFPAQARPGHAGGQFQRLHLPCPCRDRTQ